MTKVDERAGVPAIDAAARERLIQALDRPDVVAAMLFGSQAREDAGPLSDIDVAVWLAPGLTPAREADVALDLGAAAAGALRSDEVDLVVLNRATPVLRHRVLRDGVRLLERDPRQRVHFETHALLEYLDTAPLRRTLEAGVRRRLRDGRFGRR